MKEYDEEDFLMLSGIQHFKFCRRQWALIHIEKQWAENSRTVEGELFHQKAHDITFTEKRKNIIVSRAMPVHSRTLGTSGECDIVEFIANKDGINIAGRQGRYIICPVEYKKGSPKSGDEDIFQLVAQAMCLEEMFVCEIEKGYLYYGETRKRTEVIFSDAIKQEVRNAFEEMHSLFERRYTPKVKISKSCNACSLKSICLPILCKNKSAENYIKKIVSGADEI